MPTKTSLIGAEAGWSQDKQRVQKIFWDQHKNAAKGFPNGRPWFAICEKQINGSDAMPVGEMIPVTGDMLLQADGSLEIAARAGVTTAYEDGEQLPNGAMYIKGWHAPWTPEPKYVVSAMAAMRGNKFRFDYERMRHDYVEANIAYYTRANAEAAAMNWPSVKLYGAVSFQLRSVKGIGSPPKSPKVPEAALAGDLWLLGFSNEENERLVKILAKDNGRGVEPEEVLEESQQRVPSLSEFATALGLTVDDITSLKEMAAAKQAREAKKTPKEAA